MVLKPGFLSRAYIDGKRIKFFTPIKLYIFTSFIFFLISSIIPDTEVEASTETDVAIDIGEAGDSERLTLFFEKINQIFNDERQLELFDHFVVSKLPILLFLFIPFLSFGLWIFFRNKKYFYIEHLVFSIHVQASLFIILFIFDIIEIFTEIPYDIPFLIIFFITYLVIAARYFYQKKTLSTILRILGTMLIYLPLIIFSVLLFLIAAISIYDVM